MENVQLFDLGCRGGSQGDLDSRRSAQGVERDLALAGREFLRVVEHGGQRRGHAACEDHGGGDDRSGERASADLINASDATARRMFQGKVGHGCSLEHGPAERNAAVGGGGVTTGGRDGCFGPSGMIRGLTFPGAGKARYDDCNTGGTYHAD